MFAMYLVGTATAVVVAWILKMWVFTGQSSSFIIELPSYKCPQWSVVFRRMWEGGKSFVRGAGTTIVAVSIVVWAAAYFPRSTDSIPLEIQNELAGVASALAETDITHERREALMVQREQLELRVIAIHRELSFLGRAGKWIEPAVRPLGWDWRIGSAVVASFPAREVVVSTLGIVFGLGDDVDEESRSLRNALAGARWADSDRPLFNLPVAMGLLVFFALCAQCASTLAVIKRETMSWKWPLFTFLYMTALAYFGAWITVTVTSIWWG